MTASLSNASTCLAQKGPWVRLSDINWHIVFLLYTTLGLISTGTVYTTGLAQRAHQEFFWPLLWEMTGYWTIFLFLPLMVFVFGRVPIRKDNWFWTVPSHVLVSAILGAMHTFMMYGTRSGFYWVFDLGRYDYGPWGYRLLMEYHKQVLNYWFVYVALCVLMHYREARERERRAAAAEVRAAELQQQLAQAQLDNLRAQLNPHFLFNTLNMVSSVMYEDVDRADHMIAALSQMLRMRLEMNTPAVVPVRRELEFVNCALDLYRARFQERVDITVDCAPDAQNALIPNLLFYTFIENSIKHHEGDREKVIRVRARLFVQDQRLHIEVQDNGPGIAEVEKAFSKGVGLSNARDRLRVLYGSQHEFSIGNLPAGGLKVNIRLPLQTDSNPRAALPSSKSPELVEEVV